MWGGGTKCLKVLQRVEFREFFLESAAREGKGGIADGAAPVALDGVCGAAGASQQKSEGVTEGVELVEVDVSARQAVEEGDGLEGDEEEIGCVGTGPGDGILRPPIEVVDVGAGEEELASFSAGGKLAGADVVAAVEEVVIAPAHVEAVVVAASVNEERHGR